jgi:hypothetical protein
MARSQNINNCTSSVLHHIHLPGVYTPLTTMHLDSLKQLLLRRLIFSVESVVVGDHLDPTLGAAEESASCQVAFVRLPALDRGSEEGVAQSKRTEKVEGLAADQIADAVRTVSMSMASRAYHRFRSSADFSFAASLKSAKPMRSVPKYARWKVLMAISAIFSCT